MYTAIHLMIDLKIFEISNLIHPIYKASVVSRSNRTLWESI